MYCKKYFNNKYKGTATVVISGNGIDTFGSKTQTFKINNGGINNY